MKNNNKIVLFHNADDNGTCAKTILAGCYKFGKHTLLNWGGSTMTSVIEVLEDKTNMKEQINQQKMPIELQGKKFYIRKLTPRECFRLMGVDDVDIDKIQAAGISNSAQYKMAGNSIVVDVLYHVFRKMFIETGADKNNKPTQLTLF